MGPWEIVGTLAAGGTLVLYDGAPDYPGPDRLWSFVERHRVNVLGVSPTLIRALMAHGDEPVRAHDLSSLRVLASTGEPWNEGPWRWYFDVVGGGRCPVDQHLAAAPRSARASCRRTSCSRCRRARSAVPRSGMAIDVFDDDGRLGARRGRRARVHEAVAGHDPRACTAIPQRYLETYWSRYPGVWWHGDFASVERRRAVVPARPLRRHDQARGQAARARPRSRPSSSRIPAVLEAAAVGVPDELKGEALWVFVVPAPGRRARRRAARRAACACVVDALGPSFKPAAGAVHDRAAEDAEREGLAARDPFGRRPATAPGDLSGLEDPAALDAIAARDRDP